MMSQLYYVRNDVFTSEYPCALLNLRRQPIRKPFSAFAHHGRSSRVNRIGALLSPDSPLFRDDRRTKNEEAKRDETKTSPSTTPAIVVLLVHRNHRAPGPTRPGPGSRVATSIPKGWKRASVPAGVPGTGSLPGHWLFMKPRSKLRDTTKRYQGQLSSYRLSGSYFNEYARLSVFLVSRLHPRPKRNRETSLMRIVYKLLKCGKRILFTDS